MENPSPNLPAVRVYQTPASFEQGIVDMSAKGYRLHSWATSREGIAKIEAVGEIMLRESVATTCYHALFVPAVSPPPPTPNKEPMACR